MVVMSIEAYEHHQFNCEVYFRLKEAELEAKTTGKRFTHDEVFSGIRRKLQEKAVKDV